MRDESSRFFCCIGGLRWDFQMHGGHIQKFVYRKTWLVSKQTHTHKLGEREKRVRSIINTNWRLIVELLCCKSSLTNYILLNFLHYLIRTEIL